MTDVLINKNGEDVKLDKPIGRELPFKGFEVKENGYITPEENGSHIEVEETLKSERLELLTPFVSLGDKIEGVKKLLIKAYGKCTTDYISMVEA